MVDPDDLQPEKLISGVSEDRRERAFNSTVRARLKAVINDLNADILRGAFAPFPSYSPYHLLSGSNKYTPETLASLSILSPFLIACNEVENVDSKASSRFEDDLKSDEICCCVHVCKSSPEVIFCSDTVQIVGLGW